MLKKKVLVCCGTGIATSVQVANKLQRMLKERGVDAAMKECKAVEVPAQTAAFKPDAIVSTTVVKAPSPQIKVYRGVAFLTGVGADKLADEIAADLKA
ncbi:PTS sugar transporter subunit IIB [Acidipropionibacterium timonense]|uniref:PTS sugar transporter subunit IIB n=1 Tax=Acidipropionibacterium timonense TaxID=2161818 RepID=UPI0010318AD5|nr:PTS sugar transporter subunit IIB [Acidipropionibacterium timonense]